MKRLAIQQSKVADMVEQLMENNLSKSGKTDLLDNFKNARRIYKNSFDVEKALGKGGETVDAGKLATAQTRGKLTDPSLKQAGTFGGRFSKAAQASSKIGGVTPYSVLDLVVEGNAVTESITAAAMGHFHAALAGALAAGVYALRPVARKFILSETGQRWLIEQSGKRQLSVGSILKKVASGDIAIGAAENDQKKSSPKTAAEIAAQADHESGK